ncbi:MAG: hypothetical protein ACM36C_12425 [Acidobacteriota bacterium]
METENLMAHVRTICPQMSADVRRNGTAQGHGVKRDAVRERAVLALLSEKTLARVARRCGVNEKTLRRWMAEDVYKLELAHAQRAVFQAGMTRVQALAAHAIGTLEMLLGPTVPPSVRLGAARTVAELALHQHDVDTIIRRLEEIEARQREHDAERSA